MDCIVYYLKTGETIIIDVNRKEDVIERLSQYYDFEDAGEDYIDVNPYAIIY